MKWIKKNKFTCIAILLFVIVTIVGYKAMKVLFPDSGIPDYGDRLDNKVPVDNSVYENVKAKISEQEFVKDVTVRENGRTIEITVKVMDSTSIDAAKSVSNLILEHFSEIQIGYYDFQLFVVKESETENNFPIIAYKQHNRSEFSWTKDREKTETTEEEG